MNSNVVWTGKERDRLRIEKSGSVRSQLCYGTCSKDCFD